MKPTSKRSSRTGLIHDRKSCSWRRTTTQSRLRAERSRRAHPESASEVKPEERRRAAPQDFLLLGGGKPEPLYDVDVFSGVDRHWPVIGAEHDAAGAEHLERLAQVRHPETHRVDVESGEIAARQFLAAFLRARACLRSRAAIRNRAGP